MSDTITCIDRYKASTAFGTQVLPFASLLDRPRQGHEAKHLTGALAHGAKVEVIDKRQDNGDIWCKVSATVTHEGKEYVQTGWVKRQFLQNEGAAYFEAVNR
jgi:hypothetical protein